VRSWAFDVALGATRKQSVARAAIALALLAALVWALPVRHPGGSGGHHDDHAPLDAFERAGVSELKEGQRGPAFRLRRLDQGAAGLEDFSDKLVLLNFWATWCTPCTIEMPALEALWTQYRDRGVEVIGISVDRGGPRALIDPYVQTLKLTFPILLDPDLTTASNWRVTALPITFIITPGGEVAGIAVGPRDWTSREMRALIDSLLPKRRASRAPHRAPPMEPRVPLPNLEITNGLHRPADAGLEHLHDYIERRGGVPLERTKMLAPLVDHGQSQTVADESHRRKNALVPNREAIPGVVHRSPVRRPYRDESVTGLASQLTNLHFDGRSQEVAWFRRPPHPLRRSAMESSNPPEEPHKGRHDAHCNNDTEPTLFIPRNLQHL
jgi:cytochrome c biogenesis protein CcmG, thiol:disulfide interchange protein DsbE